MRTLALAAVLASLSACGDSGDGRTGQIDAAAPSGPSEPGGGDDVSGECGPCEQAPPPECAGPCMALTWEPQGTCVEGTCVYGESGRTSCPTGCDEATGACRTTTDLDPACCTTESYTKTSGFTYDGYQLCCEAGEARTAVTDCGSGDDHWVQATGENCGTAYEGSDNYGGPCVTVTCQRVTCM